MSSVTALAALQTVEAAALCRVYRHRPISVREARRIPDWRPGNWGPHIAANVEIECIGQSRPAQTVLACVRSAYDRQRRRRRKQTSNDAVIIVSHQYIAIARIDSKRRDAGLAQRSSISEQIVKIRSAAAVIAQSPDIPAHVVTKDIRASQLA